MPIGLDGVDHAILRMLATKGRISAAELARRVVLSKSPVQRLDHRWVPGEKRSALPHVVSTST